MCEKEIAHLLYLCRLLLVVQTVPVKVRVKVMGRVRFKMKVGDAVRVMIGVMVRVRG